MHYFLWIDSKQKGPYEKQQILDMLLQGIITKQTLCCPVDGAGTWNPVRVIHGLLDDLSPSPAPPAASAAEADPPASPVPQTAPRSYRDEVKTTHRRTETSELEITRRSDWSTFTRGIGVLSLIIGVGGCSVIARDEAGPGLLLAACGIVVALHAFMFAFLVNVFTDIRWFLKQLVDKRGRDDA
ncbi:MAG: DUF4339 domain-containing protein [Verrucomicrobiia bacterium]